MSLKNLLARMNRTDPWADTSRFLTDDQNFHRDNSAFEALIKALSPSLIIEVGSWKGHSANAMADICKANGIHCRIICVDTWLGSQEHWWSAAHFEELHLQNGRPTLYERFMGNVYARGNSDIITPLPLPSRTAASLLSKYDAQSDLIYIDAGHGYEDVMDDLVNYFPLLSSRGVMFGDDFPHPPLAKAVHEFAVLKGKHVLSHRRKWLLADSDDEVAGFIPVFASV